MSAAGPLQVREDPVTGVVELVGELTFATAAALDGPLRRRLAEHPRLVLDVSAVRLCDSTGLAGLIGASRRAERRGGEVVLLGVRAPLYRLLQVTGVEPLFELHRDAARSAFEGRGEPA